MYGGYFYVVMIGGVGVGGGFVYCVVYILYVCRLICCVMRSWGCSVYVGFWNEKCEY